MIKSKLTKTLATLLVATSLLAAPIQANAVWKQNNVGWWYTEGSSYATGWEKISGYWFYFNDSGYMDTGWIKYQGYWFYLDSNGTMLHDVWIQYNGNWYYLNSNGSMATSTWINSYWVGADGIYTPSNKFQDQHASLGKAGTNGKSAQSMSEANN